MAKHTSKKGRRLKMRLINKTKWDTKDLRKLCKAVIKHTGSHKDHIIEIVTCKKRRHYYSKEMLYGGYAFINGRTITMQVPLTKGVLKWIPVYHPTEKTTGSDGKEYQKIIEYQKPIEEIKFNPVTFAQVLEHEISHNLGLRDHKDMMPCGRLDCGYAKDFEVKPKAEKQKEKRNLKQERYEKAKQKVKEMESKIKRYNNLLKKWQRKTRYYERMVV